MENFTTQEHQRDSQGNAVVDNPGKTIANLREQQKTRNFVNGVIISAMALTVVLTGTMLGATAAHNSELQAKISNLEMQNQSSLTQRVAPESTNDNNSRNADNDPNTTNPSPGFTVDRNDVVRITDHSTDDDDQPAVPTASRDALMQRTWERRRNTPTENLTSTFTSRKYLSQFYNPHTRHSDFISKKVEKAVDLPKLAPKPSAAVTLKFITMTPEKKAHQPKMHDLKMS